MASQMEGLNTQVPLQLIPKPHTWRYSLPQSEHGWEAGLSPTPPPEQEAVRVSCQMGPCGSPQVLSSSKSRATGPLHGQVLHPPPQKMSTEGP